MDRNSGLTQALSDGTNTYVYGLDRIAQTHGTATDYFLTDALGSVRQLTDPTGAITFARTYDPYGVVTQTTGAAQTAYGYTGEFTANNLVYLRARQYAPGMGRFLTRDTWGGNDNSPMSYNKWNYVGSYPVNRTDHSGRCWYPNLQSGGISQDITVPSSGICPWFVNVFQSNGISIPTNATPNNWLDSLPLELRLRISLYINCPDHQNGTSLTLGQDYWMLIRFETSPKWEFYESTNTGAEFKLILGFGGGGSLSCDSEAGDCSLSGNVDLGEGGTVFGYKLALALGAEGSWDFSEGTIDLGGTADVGNCTLYVSLFRISISCGNWLDPFHSYEMGVKRDKFEEYLVVVNWNKIGPLGYEEFARKNLLNDILSILDKRLNEVGIGNKMETPSP